MPRLLRHCNTSTRSYWERQVSFTGAPSRQPTFKGSLGVTSLHATKVLMETHLHAISSIIIKKRKEKKSVIANHCHCKV